MGLVAAALFLVLLVGVCSRDRGGVRGRTRASLRCLGSRERGAGSREPRAASLTFTPSAFLVSMLLAAAWGGKGTVRGRPLQPPHA